MEDGMSVWDGDDADEFGGLFSKIRKTFTTKKGRSRRKARRAKGKGLARIRHGMTTKAGRDRRTARRKAGRGIARLKKLKKARVVLKPIGMLLRSGPVKKILNIVPFVGPAVVGMIEAGGKAADWARKGVQKVADHDELIQKAKKLGVGAAHIKRMKARGNLIARDAQQRVNRLAKIKVTERDMKRKVAGKAKAGDRRAQAALRVSRARGQGNRAELQRAKRAAAKLGVKTDGDVEKVATRKVDGGKRGQPPRLRRVARHSGPKVTAPKGKTVVLHRGRRFVFDAANVRRRARKGG